MSEQPARWTRATVCPDMWADPAEDLHTNEVSPEGELATLLDFLTNYRISAASVAALRTRPRRSELSRAAAEQVEAGVEVLFQDLQGPIREVDRALTGAVPRGWTGGEPSASVRHRETMLCPRGRRPAVLQRQFRRQEAL
ncbi:hypothetical protein [Streptomyces lydicus]|uniref:hypothetical protein n=1 Tax=Streptomyces lydicus TaxID=47763 RepID=UPI0036AD26DB